MLKNSVFLIFLIFGFMVQNSFTFPHGEESFSSEEEDETQQQQQNIDAESLEEFAKQIKTKGKVEKQQSTQPPIIISDPCLEDKRIGRCKAYLPRIFFNKAEGACQTFVFGGCGANANNFLDLADCEKVCAKHLRKTFHVVPSIVGEDVEEICTQPPITSKSANCQAYIARWTYNATEGNCVQYIYGGCSASKNNFRNEQQCQATCGNFNAKTDQPIAGILPIIGARCNLPKDNGFCYAIKDRYYFNKRNNRCELFKFGGCGGNSNNFKSANDCVRACGGDMPSEDSDCSDVDCPWELYSHYSTLGCKPIFDGQACCPTRFDCPDNSPRLNNTLGEGKSLNFENVTSPNTQCHYKGKFYNIGEEMPEASDSGSCRAACICQETRPGKAKIMCANIECPENFGEIPTDKVNCLPLYKRGGCCVSDYYCPNDTLIIIEPGQENTNIAEPIFKCNIDGESYYEGQRFYPNKAKCLKCICAKGFKGDLTDEFCENIDCGIEIYYSDYLERGCSPLNYQSSDGTSSCCPYTWICPDEIQEQSSSPPPVIAPTRPTTSRPPRTSGLGLIPITEESISRNKLITQEACELEKAVGPCKGLRPRYFYNKTSNQCEQFEFSGCLGNENNFVSIQDCQQLCVTNVSDNQVLSRTWDANQQQPQPTAPRAIYVTEMDPCTMPKKTGVCKGFFHRYFYSPVDNSCSPFIYGGCRGNANNFYSQGSCEASCTSNKVYNPRVSVPTRFRQRTDSLGDSTMVKFEDVPSRSNNAGGSEASGRVSPTTSSQVQPTDERNLTGTVVVDSNSVSSTWRSFSQLHHHLERCLIPKKSGSCLQVIPSYYYDVETNTCNFFVYSGCLGNANRFSSLDECETQCKRLEPENQGGEGIGGRILGLPWRQNKVAVVSESDGSRDTLRSRRPISPEEAEEVCKLSPVQGPCKAHILRFHWDISTKQCLPFVFSGCRENRNNFVSESDCLSVCRRQPTIEQLTSDGILSCTFGNETLPVGATVQRFKQNKKWNPNSQENEFTCGVPICQCITPPSVTCFQTSCPTPPPPSPTTEKVCATPSCGLNCKEAIGIDGCPTCDCDNTQEDSQVQVVEDQTFVKKG